MLEDAHKLSKRRMLWLGLTVLLLLGLWYLFRPEKLLVNKRVAEPPPSSAVRLTPIYTGSFHGNGHVTTGRATVYQQPNGSRILTLSNFSTSNAPLLHVILLEGTNLAPNQDLALSSAGDRDLGELKATQAEQSYALPPEVDLNRFNTVVIYSASSKAIFGTATLDAF